jgi:hypothetical protein
MLNPNWKYVDTVQKRIRIIKVDTERRVNAVDIDERCPLLLSASEQVDLSKVKRAKIYQATIKAFEAELTPELESQMLEAALGDPNRTGAIKAMKASGYKPTKYELIALKH